MVPILRSIAAAAASLSLVAAAALVPASQARADDWPSRSIKYIVPFAPGGTADGSARILATELAKRLGQPVVVENRPGVSGIVGTQAGASAAPDGYTLVAGTINTHAVNPYFYKNLGYDAVKQFEPVTLLGVASNVLIVPANSRFDSVQQIIDESRAKPGSLTYGTSGAGTSQNLAGELFQVMGGIKLEQIPYKGGASALSDLVGGNIDMIFETETAARKMIEAKRVKALAVTARTELESLPGVPPIASLKGFEGFETQSWTGLFVPAGTPPAIVERLGREASAIMKSPEVVEKMRAIGMVSIGAGPAEFRKFQQDEIAKWGDIVRKAGIEPK